MYRKLDSAKIVDTLERLGARISERFPGAGISQVCAELTATARASQARSEAISRPDMVLRSAVGLTLVIGLTLLAMLGHQVMTATRASDDMFGALQSIDSAFNLIVLMGAALFFLVTLEDRMKRKRALTALHELRSIIHVIDMHQLTKDPSAEVAISQATPSSPKRTLSAFELVRYLDYCSEMLSLASKVAVLYSQSFPDPVVAEAVNDVERTASSLAQKIWQKINILQRSLDAAESANRALAAAARPAVAAPMPAPPIEG